MNYVEVIIALCLIGQSSLIVILGYTILKLKEHIQSLENKITIQEHSIGKLQAQLLFRCEKCLNNKEWVK